MKKALWIKIPLFIALVVFGVSWVVMLLWNALIPDLFHGPVLSYWQAVGLFLLCKILFDGPGGRHKGPGWKRDQYWKKRFAERMASMTPEERIRCRERWKYCDDVVERDVQQNAEQNAER